MLSFLLRTLHHIFFFSDSYITDTRSDYNFGYCSTMEDFVRSDHTEAVTTMFLRAAPTISMPNGYKQAMSTPQSADW